MLLMAGPGGGIEEIHEPGGIPGSAHEWPKSELTAILSLIR